MVGGLRLSILFAALLLAALTACSGDDTQQPEPVEELTWYEDFDDDGYTSGNTLLSATQPPGYVLETALANTVQIDCDDENATTYPGAPELMDDSLDNNCDGAINERPWFPFAFSSLAGTVGPNIRPHWGDVAIRGTLEEPNRRFTKDNSLSTQFDNYPYTGPWQNDRFVDFYVGHTDDDLPYPDGHISIFGLDPLDLSVNYIPQPDTLPVVQFYLDDDYGNYFSNLSNSKISQMLVELDYEIFRDLAISHSHNSYWVTAWIPGAGGSKRIEGLYNPVTRVHVSDLSELLESPETNPNNNGEFIFIDTYGSTTDHVIFGIPVIDPGATPLEIMDFPTIRQLAADDLLPTHRLEALRYTTGLIYVAGNVEWRGSGSGGQVVTAQTPPEYDVHYEHNAWPPAFYEDQLPIEPDGAEGTASFPLEVNLNGALYLNGYLSGIGGPMIYGAITAESGLRGTLAPEIWYNYHYAPENILLPESGAGGPSPYLTIPTH